MTLQNAKTRRIGRDIARLVAAVSACMLVLSAWTVVSSSGSPVAAQAAGGVTVSPTSGGSATEFELSLPDGAACSGDSASGGYLVQSYMVPAAVDPGTLTFSSIGPEPSGTGAAYRQPLFNGGDSFVSRGTDVETGIISGLPPFSFSLFGAAGPEAVPEGDYNIGIACVRGTDTGQELDKYWNAQLTITHDEGDSPSGLTWTASESQPTTTTTSTTATTIDGATTTTTVGDGSTTTTVPDAGSTTTIPGTDGGAPTPSSVASSGLGGGTPTGAGVVTPSGVLPYTGNSPWNLVIWGVLLVVCGRIAVLLGRKPRVRVGPSR